MSPESSIGYRTLLSLAWPIVVARSAQAVIGFSDALMTAPLGEAPLAAVTTGSMNAFFWFILPMGLVFIAQSFAAQFHGQGELDAAVRYAWYALILSGVAMVISIGSIPLIGPVLGQIGYDPDVHSLMTSYLEIRLLAAGAAIGVEALGNWYGGLGNTRLHMMAGLVMMVVNVFLNWVLIHGNLGAPALGVEGAAIASVIASWVGFAVIAYAFLTRRGTSLPSVRPKGLAFSELRRMVRFGMPHGMNWFLEFAAFVLFLNVFVGGLGTVVLAAFMVVFNINSVSFMPAFGISSAGSIMSGQAIGRGELDLVPRIVRRTLTVAATWQGTVGLLYVLAPHQLMALFASSPDGSVELMRIGPPLLALSAAWQLSDAVAMGFAETLRAAGDTTWTLYARLLVAWFVFTPAAYLSVAVYDGGHIAAMLCMIGYLTILAVVFWFRFRGGKWREIDLTGARDALV